MFVRIKKIKGKEYAYLVKNTWKEGKVKQKTIKYLGKVNNFKSSKTQDFDEQEPMPSIISNTLINAGFSNQLELNGIKVDLEKQKISLGKREGVIKLNEGILSSITIKKLLNYEIIEETKPGLKLAKLLSESGIDLDQNTFIKLYQVLHAN